jgi:hypothetical protein
VGAGEGANEVMEWQRWKTRRIGWTTMGGTLDRSGGDKRRTGSEQRRARGVNDKVARGQLGAYQPIG